MLGGKGRVWFDLIAAVTVSLGVVCLEYLGGSSITQGLCARAAENPLAGSSMWLARGPPEKFYHAPLQTGGNFSL